MAVCPCYMRAWPEIRFFDVLFWRVGSGIFVIRMQVQQGRVVSFRWYCEQSDSTVCPIIRVPLPRHMPAYYVRKPALNYPKLPTTASINRHYLPVLPIRIRMRTGSWSILIRTITQTIPGPDPSPCRILKPKNCHIYPGSGLVHYQYQVRTPTRAGS